MYVYILYYMENDSTKKLSDKNEHKSVSDFLL